MNLLTEKISRLYAAYLLPCVCSSMVTGIYTIVDMIAVGRYEGPGGTAALAVMSPMWILLCCAGLLFGIGGSVLLSNDRGMGLNGNTWFSSSLIGLVVVVGIIWVIVGIFDEQMLRFFGANDEILPLASAYLDIIKYCIPLYPLCTWLSAFLRNDGNPNLAAVGVLAGGLFNIFGDVYFTFTLDMGIRGAALASVLGQVIAVAIQLAHFAGKRNKLRFVRTTHFIDDMRQICAVGFPSFIIDVSLGSLGVFFNNRIMGLMGPVGLAVYGVANNMMLGLQYAAYGISNAAQPIFSANHGARNHERVMQTFKMGMKICGLFGIASALFCMLIPETIIRIFMTPTQAVLELAPAALRVYFLSFALLFANVLCSYFLQSVRREYLSSLLSILRGFVISGILILALPALWGSFAIWWVMPITELSVFIVSISIIRDCNRKNTQE